jgi:hypothetical protein
VQGVWVAVDGTGLLGCSRRRYRERRERGKRVGPGGWRRLQGEEQQGRAIRVWVAGPLVGLRVRDFFSKCILNSLKIHKNSPKLFINKIFIFRLIIFHQNYLFFRSDGSCARGIGFRLFV